MILSSANSFGIPFSYCLQSPSELHNRVSLNTSTLNSHQCLNKSNITHFVLFCFAVRGPLTVVASPVAEHRLRTRRLSGHGSRAQQLTGLAAPRHVGSSRTGARTRVPCIGRRTPNHRATREAQPFLINDVRKEGGNNSKLITYYLSFTAFYYHLCS